MRLTQLAMWLALSLSAVASGQEVPLTGEATIVFYDRTATAAFLQESDAFTSTTSALERNMRLRTEAEVSESDLLKYQSDQALDWTAAEVDQLRESIKACHELLAKWKLPLPRSIPLIKTTGKEEGGAAYTRRAAVILPEPMLRSGGPNVQPLLLHELFHVLSRHNPELRKEMYAIIGFEPCGAGKLPVDVEEHKVTNPDAPTYDYAISLTIDGRAGKYLPVIRSKSTDPSQGFLIRQLDFLLMEIDGDGKRWQPVLNDGQPTLLPISQKAYEAKIGRNTGYTIHAEEVLADNFSLLIREQRDVPSPEILEKLEDVLRKHAGNPSELESLEAKTSR